MRCLATSLTTKAPYKGLGADSEEKREPVSDIDTAVVDSLKVLDPNRPIREADVPLAAKNVCFVPNADIPTNLSGIREHPILGDDGRTFDAMGTGQQEFVRAEA